MGVHYHLAPPPFKHEIRAVKGLVGRNDQGEANGNGSAASIRQHEKGKASVK
ncbi:MAG: hypothetical protein K9M97_13640 [Akkermansiaceae bacterium]|nr:hypothetical protein [Akkermansiaceae bacterium]